MPIYTLNTAEVLINELIEKFKSRLLADLQLQLKNKKQAKLDAQKLFASIVPVTTNSWALYQALIHWANKVLSNDAKPIVVLKKWLTDQHRIIFAAQIQKADDKSQQEIKHLVAQKKQEQVRHTIAIKKLQMNVEEQQQAIKTLEQHGQKLVAIQLSDKANLSQHQAALKQLKATAGTIKLELSPLFNFPILQNKPNVVALIHMGQRTALELLDQNIKRYQKMLDSENVIVKFFNWFSSERDKRRAALNDYHSQVACLSYDNVAARFAAAEQWHASYAKAKHSSRFYKFCLAPFETVLVQQRFEHLFCDPNQQAQQLKFHQDAIQNAHRSHQEKAAVLQEELYRLSEVQQKLQTNIRKFCMAAQQAQPNMAQLQQQQTDLKALLGIPKTKLDAAKEIALQLKTLLRDMDLKALKALNLKEKVVVLESDLGATTLVYQAIEQLLKDMSEFSGKQNNSDFAGSGVVEFVVTEIGSSEQQKQFKKLKSQADQVRVDLNYHQQMLEANNFVKLLNHELKNNVLQLKLYQWWNAYQKHKYMDGKLPDAQSEEVYQQVRHYTTKAQKIHQAKNYVLEDWVQETLNYKHTNNLSPEEATMLVMMFGTEKQKAHWKTVEVPKINQETELNQEQHPHYHHY